MTITDGRTATTEMPLNFDPQLHILRSIANTLEDPKQRQKAQSARFKLYEALQADDAALATSWLDALEVALATAAIPDSGVREKVERAITTIRGGLE